MIERNRRHVIVEFENGKWNVMCSLKANFQDMNFCFKKDFRF